MREEEKKRLIRKENINGFLLIIDIFVFIFGIFYLPFKVFWLALLCFLLGALVMDYLNTRLKLIKKGVDI